MRKIGESFRLIQLINLIMKFVEIYKTQNDGNQKVVLICKLVDNVVVCEGDEQIKRNLETGGIHDYEKDDNKKIFLIDGIRFLRQLKFHFKSGYINASDIKEDSVSL